MQPVDFTTLTAVTADLRSHWLPARCEQVYQRDRFTIFMALRTINRRGWLAISWHPQAARLHMAPPPPKAPDTFTFSQQLKHQLGGLALTKIEPLAPWERAFDLQFARRPDEPALWHLYVEIMGKYSNVILTTANQQIVTAAHQVSEQQSSVRPIQTGQPYVEPPAIRGKLPNLSESFVDWRDRIALIPGKLKKMMVKAYSGVSSAIATQLVESANLPLTIETTDLDEADWQNLFDRWQSWLDALQSESFEPGWRGQDRVQRKGSQEGSQIKAGYTVLGVGITHPVENVQVLLDDYYRHQFNQEEFRRLHHQLHQRLKNKLSKLRQKADTFSSRLEQSNRSEAYRQQADLMMANLHLWKPGMTQIELADFETGEPVTLSLNLEKNAVQNAQALYKQHQKLKRAKDAVVPLLNDVNQEIRYLEQVEDALLQVPSYQAEEDLRSLEEIRSELVAQNYLPDLEGRYQLGKPSGRKSKETNKVDFRRYQMPQGFELLVGRNNSQNEQLTFKQASDYDLWFHAQEIPGSHVLLRLDAGQVPSDDTLQLAASIAAYYSRARQSEQVPVVYTEPKNVYKPKGALPGMAIYKQEQVLWGQPDLAASFIAQSDLTRASTNSLETVT